MVSMTATVDGAASEAFQAALGELAKSLGEGTATAPRRAAITLCKSFRAGTRSAPKYARSSEYTATKSDADPQHKYITSKDGRKLRRWSLSRPPRGTAYDVYAESKKDLRLNKLMLFHRGLAKQSWGWVMHNIFNGAAPDAAWRRRKRDQRDPKDATRESCSSEHNGAFVAQGGARICNRLDYIGDALKISVDEAVRKATNKIIRPIINARLRKEGVSSGDIKSAAHSMQAEWMRQFGT